MTRFVPVCAAVMIALGALAAPEAHAQANIGTLPNGSTIQWQRLLIVEDGERKVPTTPDVLRQYLNRAHCVCSREDAGDETTIQYELRLSGNENLDVPGQIWVGNNECDDDVQRTMDCAEVGAISDIDQLSTRVDTIELSLFETINGPDLDSECVESDAGQAFIWVLVDSDSNGSFDYFANQVLGNTDMTPSNDQIRYDTKPPPLPTNFRASAAENAIALSWTPVDTRQTDVLYFQALCAKADGSPADLESRPKPRYQTVQSLCGISNSDAEIEEVNLPTVGGTPATLIDPLRQLDPAYLCAESADPAAAGMTIRGLENGKAYSVVLLSIDRAGNPSGVFFTTTITPQPVVDFWEDLHDRGSNVEGGFCLLAETYGDGGPLTQTLRAFRDQTLAQSAFGRVLIDAYYATLAPLGAYVADSLVLRVIAGIVLLPLVAIALAWHALTLPGLLLAIASLVVLARVWRRRRRLALAAAMVMAPAVASAQSQPYWMDDIDAQVAEEGEVNWHVGVRVGLYTPEIDKQFGMDPGPYDEMFGGSQVLPMLDIDRVIWRGFGQLTIGGTIGYMQKSANAWLADTTPGPNRPRSEGDENTFRLLPLALTASYRFTYLDDALGIPLVPYLRGGLSYYLWWFRTNGRTSSACWDGTHDPDCDADKAIGATAGLQGAIGIAIRAERIDADAAASMRASGILHAGFYAEFSAAWVDGFGREEKLSVGDKTWFAGVNFEF